MQKARLIPRVRLGLLVATLLVGSTACVYFRELVGLGPKKPTVTLRQVLVKKASLTEVDLELTLRVFNPNSFALKLNRMVYQISAFDYRLAHGNYPHPFEAPSEAHSELTIPLTIDMGNTQQLLQRYMQNPQKIKIRMEADVDFATPLGSMEFTFEEEKPISLQ